MAQADTTASGGIAHRIQDAAVRGLIATALSLPYATRIRLFGQLSARLAAPATKLGRRIDENLSFIYPDMPVPERRRLGRTTADRIGRMIIEMYSWRDLATRMAAVPPTGPGWEAFQAAQAEGRPVFLVTGHFGNYLAARASVEGRGHLVGGLYRPMENPYFNRHYVDAMVAGGGPVFADTVAGMKGLMRYMRGGGAVMLLNDLYIGSGVEMPFLGQPAMTSTSPAEIAQRVGALMIPIWGTRQADGLSFSVELEAPLPMGDPVGTTLAYNRSTEARIRAHPEQWFWMHRRWKKKWNKGKGLEETLHPAQLPSRRSRL